MLSAEVDAEAAAADWYVGVVALDGGEPAEFSLQLSSRLRVAPAPNYTCDRMAHFCPTEQRVENVSGYDPADAIDTTSAATMLAAPGWMLWAAVVAACIGSTPPRRGRRLTRRILSWSVAVPGAV